MDWINEPIESHLEWMSQRSVAGRSYAVQSQRQYHSMFAVFAKWVLERGQDLSSVQEGDIRLFIESLKGRDDRDASARTVHGYMLEINRVFAHLVVMGVREDNPATILSRKLNTQNPIRARNSAIAGAGLRDYFLASLERVDPVHSTIETVRKNAMALLMLEEGFTLKEVQKLTLAGVAKIDFGAVTAPGHRNLRSREITVSDVTKLWLGEWLRRRSMMEVRPRVQRRKKPESSKASSARDVGALASAEKSAASHATTVRDSVLPDGLPASSISLESARVFVTLPSGKAGSLSQYIPKYAVNHVSPMLIRDAAESLVLEHTKTGPKALCEDLRCFAICA